MLYAILCYDSEDVVGAWSREEEASTMARLGAVQERWKAEGRLGPVARLMPTTAAVTLRKGGEPLVLDGPFAETKEQLLGFYLLECPDLDGALDAARQLAGAKSTAGSYEVRPVLLFHPNDPAAGDPPR